MIGHYCIDLETRSALDQDQNWKSTLTLVSSGLLLEALFLRVLNADSTLVELNYLSTWPTVESGSVSCCSLLTAYLQSAGQRLEGMAGGGIVTVLSRLREWRQNFPLMCALNSGHYHLQTK